MTSDDKRLVAVPGASAGELRDWLRELKWDPNGLVSAVIVDPEGRVLMLGHMNNESLARTLETGETWFWSRSRRELWHKGETSGHFQKVKSIAVDCDGDALLITVEQTGAACHEGDYSCFHYRLPGAPAPEAEPGIGGMLAELEAVLHDRKRNPDPESYTSKLFARGADAYLKKVGEEATEVVLAVKNGDRENLAFEVADLWFHSLVALVDQGVPLSEVARELAARRGKRRAK